MATRVFVDGQEGTTGLRIHEYLAAARRRRGAARAPELAQGRGRARAAPQRGRRRVPLPSRCRGARSGPPGDQPRTCLIDASTAHRTATRLGLRAARARRRSARRAFARRSASPIRAATATGFILLVRPLVDAGLLSSTAALSATSITGYSGGGKKMIEQYEAGGDARLASPRPYGLRLAHKHLPEMTVHGRLEAPPVFMPIVGNFLKGLSVAVPAAPRRAEARHPAEHLQAALAERYAGERFVRVMPLRDPGDACRWLLRRPGVQRHQPRRAVRLRERDAGAADVASRQPRQGRERRRGAVDERPPRHRRRHRAGLSRHAAAHAASGGVR